MFLCAGGAAAAAPLLYVRHARKRRVRKIEEQFPDALDFLSRAMRAGHAFSVSLEMLADEMPEPVGGEFRKLYHEQNLGAPIEVALQALADRCGLLDVQFFVSAVLLHKETGGNLTEILTRLSFTIRERLRLKGQVRAASAHGRVTGMVLTAMPLFLMLGLTVTSPDYLPGLVNDPMGRYLIAGAVGGQFIGYLCIRTITDIQV
jgi:tight adherence protein B